ncbi:MAG: DUF389 domain-containing protein [Magnetococcales bacterium]|nr:DUF389 domain-containing protein [Magnetococcales bacterium]
MAHSVILSDANKHGTLTPGFAFMTVMSLCLATLGLLLNSPSVIIGAMLVSPLMDPIVAIGFALASIDFAMLLKGCRTLLAGILLAISFSLLLVTLSPINDLTAEILARTRPNLFDLLPAGPGHLRLPDAGGKTPPRILDLLPGPGLHLGGLRQHPPHRPGHQTGGLRLGNGA